MTKAQTSGSEGLPKSIVSNVIASILTAAILAIGGYLVSTQVSVLAPYAVYLAMLAGIASGSVATWMFIGRSKTRPQFDSLDFDFEVEDLQISYRYRENDTIQYVKRKRLRALKGGLRSYPDKYHWTGEKKPLSLKSRIKEHSLRETGRHTVWNHYEIDFGHVLAKGEVVQTELVWELDDSAHLSEPFMSATIEEPTGKISFELVFPDYFDIRTITCNVLSSSSAKRPFVDFARN